MAPRSQLEILTSSVLRLVNEEASYHRELKEQTEHIQQLENAQGGEDENREYMLKQEVGGLFIDYNRSQLLMIPIIAPFPPTNQECPSILETED